MTHRGVHLLAPRGCAPSYEVEKGARQASIFGIEKRAIDPNPGDGLHA